MEFEQFESLVIYQMATLVNRLNREVAHIVKTEAGLRLPEWRCLGIIARYEPITASQISNKALMDAGLVSRTVKSLIEIDLVASTEVDNRSKLLRLTPNGAETMRHMMPIAYNHSLSLLEAIPGDGATSLRRIIKALHQHLDDHSIAAQASRNRRKQT